MKLMRLQVPTGWAVCQNAFEDTPNEPGVDHLREDLLQLCRLRLEDGRWNVPEDPRVIDLGWYPEGDPTGEFVLQLVDATVGQWNVIREFRSRNRTEIRLKIEEWLQEQ